MKSTIWRTHIQDTARWNGSAETAQKMAEEAKRLAGMHQNPGVAEEAGLLAAKALGQ